MSYEKIAKKFAGADWVKDNYFAPNGMSDLGVKVADILGQVFRGIYHLDYNHLKKCEWDKSFCMEILIGKGLSNYDFAELSELLILCFDNNIKFDIRPASPRVLRLLFWQRKQGDNKFTEIISLEKMIKKTRENLGLMKAEV